MMDKNIDARNAYEGERTSVLAGRREIMNTTQLLTRQSYLTISLSVRNVYAFGNLKFMTISDIHKATKLLKSSFQQHILTKY